VQAWEDALAGKRDFYLMIIDDFLSKSAKPGRVSWDTVKRGKRKRCFNAPRKSNVQISEKRLWGAW